MTRAHSPRILIVSSLFTPSRRIGARRPERFASGLVARGWDVTILTLNATYMVPLDPVYKADPAVEVIRTGVVRPGAWIRDGVDWLRETGWWPGKHSPADPAAAPGSSPSTTAPPLVDRATALFWRAVHAWEFPDPLFLWRPVAVPRVRDRRFDVVLGAVPTFTAALIAADVARSAGGRLVLDYRDPWADLPQEQWTRYGNRGLVERHRSAEDRCLGEARLVVATSPTLCRWLAARTRAKVILVQNSAEPREPAGTQPDANDPYVIYAGTLAYGRSLAPVIRAIRKLADRGVARVPRLLYAGDGGADVRREASAAGIPDRVVDLGQLGVSETRRRVGGALASVVVSSDRYMYQLPAKIFDLLPERRPILLIAADEADAADLVRRHALGWTHTPDDVDGIARSLMAMVDGPTPAPRDLEALGNRRALDTLDASLRETLG